MSSSGRSNTASLPAIFLSWRMIEESIGLIYLYCSSAAGFSPCLIALIVNLPPSCGRDPELGEATAGEILSDSEAQQWSRRILCFKLPKKLAHPNRRSRDFLTPPPIFYFLLQTKYLSHSTLGSRLRDAWVA